MVRERRVDETEVCSKRVFWKVRSNIILRFEGLLADDVEKYFKFKQF